MIISASLGHATELTLVSHSCASSTSRFSQAERRHCSLLQGCWTAIHSVSWVIGCVDTQLGFGVWLHHTQLPHLYIHYALWAPSEDFC